VGDRVWPLLRIGPKEFLAEIPKLVGISQTSKIKPY